MQPLRIFSVLLSLTIATASPVFDSADGVSDDPQLIERNTATTVLQNPATTVLTNSGSAATIA